MKKTNFFLLYLTAIAAVLFLGACNSTDSAEGSYQSANVYDKPMFGEIARRSADYEGPARNPVIFIHGFLGANLRNRYTGENAWGNFTGRQMLSGFSKNYFRQLAFAMEPGKPLTKLPNKLEAVKLLTNINVRIMALNFDMTAYQSIINILKTSGYIPESQPLPKDKKFYSLFSFYYDWRDDIAANSRRLHQFIMVRKKYLQRKYKKYYGLDNFDVQFDIVAHSMGGLVTRYYLRYGDQDIPPEGKGLPVLDWRGSKNVDKAIIVGTPNAGYLDTCLELTNGLVLDRSLPVFPPGLVGTFPSIYQMMPVSGMRAVVLADKPGKPEVDIFDPKVWIARNWGLADPGQDQILKVLLPKVDSAEKRREIALDHLRKCLSRAEKFTRAMSIESDPPDDVMLILFAGDAVKTSRCATVNPKTGKLEVIDWAPGDGKILSSSARFDQRIGRKKWSQFIISPIKWRTVINVQGAHMGIMDSYSFIDNMSYYLLAFSSPKKHAARRYLDGLDNTRKK